jgi:hypothetical protein
MEAFLSRRAEDTRFQNERRVSPVGGGFGGEWYLAQKRDTRSSHHTFSASYDENHKMTPHKDESDSGRKKKKKKTEKHYEFSKSGEPFSKAEKEKLSNRTSSDDSDSGPCWSDYERVPGTKAGEKGSCKPKGGKKD